MAIDFVSDSIFGWQKCKNYLAGDGMYTGIPGAFNKKAHDGTDSKE